MEVIYQQQQTEAGCSALKDESDGNRETEFIAAIKELARSLEGAEFQRNERWGYTGDGDTSTFARIGDSYVGDILQAGGKDPDVTAPILGYIFDAKTWQNSESSKEISQRPCVPEKRSGGASSVSNEGELERLREENADLRAQKLIDEAATKAATKAAQAAQQQAKRETVAAQRERVTATAFIKAAGERERAAGQR
ncbi:hypothetical protein OAJ27_02050, partial [bacterium]|nr:hypothetical protein [bacterium]